MDGETINSLPLVRSLGSEDADKVKEVNFSNKYYWMLNKANRKVPVAVNLETSCLKRGFVHTDRVVYSDDLEKRVHAPAPVTPMEAVAKMAEKMAENTEAMKDIIATPAEDKSLEKMPFFTLKKMAKEAGMDVTGKTKDEILAFLQQ
jgi:hypothetical protein